MAEQNEKTSSWRMMNKDGSFNITRKGMSFHWATDLYHSLLSVGWWRFLMLVILTYVAINLLFASAYYLCGPDALASSLTIAHMDRFLDAFFFSVQTFATIGYGKLTPVGIIPNLLVTIEALVGLLCTALTTGLLFARFSRPTARVTFSEVAVILNHDGIPSLIFRMANDRLNQIVDAEVSVVLSISEITAEGERYRTFYDLKLERGRSPIFALTWTVVHPITKESPLHQMSHEKLMNAGAEVIVTLTGIDDTFSQTIHARYSYVPEEIKWNHRFDDIMTRTHHGLLEVDIKRIHDISPNL